MRTLFTTVSRQWDHLFPCWDFTVVWSQKQGWHLKSLVWEFLQKVKRNFHNTSAKWNVEGKQSTGCQTIAFIFGKRAAEALNRFSSFHTYSVKHPSVIWLIEVLSNSLVLYALSTSHSANHYIHYLTDSEFIINNNFNFNVSRRVCRATKDAQQQPNSL